MWAALRHEDATLTLEAVGAMIGTSNMGQVGEQIKKAIVLGLPVQKEGAEGAAPKEGPSIG